METARRALSKKLLFWQLQALFFILIRLAAALFVSFKVFYWLCLFSLSAGAYRFPAGPAFWLAGVLLWLFASRKTFVLSRDFFTFSGTAYKASELLPRLSHYLPPAADFLAGKARGDAGLAERHLEEAAERTGKAPALLFARGYPGRECLKFVLLAVLAALPPDGKSFAFADFLNPFRQAVAEDYFSISPGDLEMIEKQDFALSVCPSARFEESPYLTLGDSYGKMRKEGPCFLFLKKNVTEGFEYRLSAGGLRSRKYRVKVLGEPGFGRVKTEVFPPAYLSAAAEEYDFIPENLSVAEGAGMVFSFFSPKGVEALHAEIKTGSGTYSRPVRVSEKGGYFFRQTPSADSEISFHIRSKNGYSGLFSRSFVRISGDSPPKCEILNYSPEEKLLPGSSLRVEYSAEDDIGLKELYAVKELYSGSAVYGKEERKLAGFGSSPREVSGSLLVGAQGLSGAVHFEISLRGRDVKGQGCASKKIKLMPDGAAEAHAENLERMARYLAGLENLQGEMSAAAPDAEKIEISFSSLRRKGSLIKSGLSADDFFEKWSRENASNAVSRVEKAESELLPGFLSDGTDREEILGAISASASEIRLSLEMEGVASLGDLAGGMENSLMRMEELLSGGGGEPDFSGLEAELAGLLAELEKLEKLLPAAELSREDPGEKRIFSLPAGEIAGHAEALKQALKNRDLKAARDYLKKLSESVRKASNILSEYREYAYENSGVGARSAAADRLKEKWEALYLDEKREFSGNSAYGDLFLPVFESRREAAAGEALKKLYEIKKSTLAPEVSLELEKNAQVLQKGEYSRLSSGEALALLPPEAAELISAFSGNGNFTSPAEKERFYAAASSQEVITARAFSLKKEVEETFFFPEPVEKLGKAAAEMQAAEKKLASFDLEGVLSCQLRAVNYLEQGKNEFAEKTGEFMKSFRSGAVSPRRPGYRQAAEGAAGVKLPGREEYSPPELIRREVMKSMGEKTPSGDRETLQKYYKNITK